MSKKPIIVFEGIEGSGKSHHISVVLHRACNQRSPTIWFEYASVCTCCRLALPRRFHES